MKRCEVQLDRKADGFRRMLGWFKAKAEPAFRRLRDFVVSSPHLARLANRRKETGSVPPAQILDRVQERDRRTLEPRAEPGLPVRR